jgi:hypothetical protein
MDFRIQFYLKTSFLFASLLPFRERFSIFDINFFVQSLQVADIEGYLPCCRLPGDRSHIIQKFVLDALTVATISMSPGVVINYFQYCFGAGRDSSVGIGAGLSGVRIPMGERFSVPVQTGPGAHPASYAMGTGSLSQG